jgi:hypothetical protein
MSRIRGQLRGSSDKNESQKQNQKNQKCKFAKTAQIWKPLTKQWTIDKIRYETLQGLKHTKGGVGKRREKERKGGKEKRRRKRSEEEGGAEESVEKLENSRKQRSGSLLWCGVR